MTELGLMVFGLILGMGMAAFTGVGILIYYMLEGLLMKLKCRRSKP